jgi:hypothetical protein
MNENRLSFSVATKRGMSFGFVMRICRPPSRKKSMQFRTSARM